MGRRIVACDFLLGTRKMMMKQRPRLQTERLILRPFEMRDTADVQRLAGNFAIADTTLNIPYPYEDGMAEQWIGTHQARFEAGELVNFAITLLAGGELVGAMGLVIEHRFDRAELGYWIGRPFWGKGYCTEAGFSVVRYGFVDLGLNRIHAAHFSRNPASGRVMQKLGMTREGILRQHTKKWDRYEDRVEYGLLKAEWKEYSEPIPASDTEKPNVLNDTVGEDIIIDKEETEQTHALWNRVAYDWDIQVGDKGDSNRVLNSDPVLWDFVGDVAGLKVLDVGCGTGYLSRMLHERGADVIGIDFSEKMIEIANGKNLQISFQIDSCSEHKTVSDDSVDVVIGNYVLMDTPDLTGALKAFNRVLKTNGFAVVVFSHPCFPQGRATVSTDGQTIQYFWPFPYFEQRKCIDPPWAHFTSEFIWFHRPLSDYWKAFISSGFEVVKFEEPVITEDRYHLAGNGKILNFCRTRPCSVAFKLRKRHQIEGKK